MGSRDGLHPYPRRLSIARDDLLRSIVLPCCLEIHWIGEAICIYRDVCYYSFTFKETHPVVDATFIEIKATSSMSDKAVRLRKDRGSSPYGSNKLLCFRPSSLARNDPPPTRELAICISFQ